MIAPGSFRLLAHSPDHLRFRWEDPKIYKAQPGTGSPKMCEIFLDGLIWLWELPVPSIGLMS